MTSVSISVTELAKFVHRQGDIDARREDSTDMSEGVQAQRKYQETVLKKFKHYQTEVRCQDRYERNDIKLLIQGRADGVMLKPQVLVEEIKTTRKNIDDHHKLMGSVHRAQVILYAAMLVQDHQFDSCTVKITYVHPDTLSFKSFDEEVPTQELAQFLAQTCEVYMEFIQVFLNRLQNRDQLTKNQEIPFDDVADDQLNLARRVYMSIRDGENLMFEAPTGTGKTVATLFPSVKALGENLIDRTVFATARTTGQAIAQETMRNLSAANPHLRAITITAKDRICFTPGALCVPEQCEYAKGHYDRLSAARSDLLKHAVADKTSVELVARTRKVCPYELSLDVADWSDIVICDYNYVFDPFVSLKRLQSRQFQKLALLVDEAHRLYERTVEMLSAELNARLFEQIHDERPTQTLGQLAQRITAEIDSLKSLFLQDAAEALIESPGEEFWTMLTSFLEVVEDIPIESTSDVIYQCWSAVLRFVEGRDRCEPSAYIYLIKTVSGDLVLQMRCILPRAWIKNALSEYKGSVRFSGTLSPFEVFQECHGVEGISTRVSINTNTERLRIYVLPQISTYYKDREESIHAIAGVLDAVGHSSKGNWLVAFPSFDYLNLLPIPVSLNGLVRKQEIDMNIEERREFIDWMNVPNTRFGLVVMGGVFTESVDYEQEGLSGVIVVGPAIPPPSIELERIAQSSEFGYELAYRQPGMTRVIQAAGRVVRGVNDRGVVVLIDPRFSRVEFQKYFPQHWSPKTVTLARLQQDLTEFWHENKRLLPDDSIG